MSSTPGEGRVGLGKKPIAIASPDAHVPHRPLWLQGKKTPAGALLRCHRAAAWGVGALRGKWGGNRTVPPGAAPSRLPSAAMPSELCLPGSTLPPALSTPGRTGRSPKGPLVGEMPRTMQSKRKLICSPSAEDRKKTPAPAEGGQGRG